MPIEAILTDVAIELRVLGDVTLQPGRLTGGGLRSGRHRRLRETARRRHQLAPHIVAVRKRQLRHRDDRSRSLRELVSAARREHSLADAGDLRDVANLRLGPVVPRADLGVAPRLRFRQSRRFIGRLRSRSRLGDGFRRRRFIGGLRRQRGQPAHVRRVRSRLGDGFRRRRFIGGLRLRSRLGARVVALGDGFCRRRNHVCRGLCTRRRDLPLPLVLLGRRWQRSSAHDRRRLWWRGAHRRVHWHRWLKRCWCRLVRSLPELHHREVLAGPTDHDGPESIVEDGSRCDDAAILRQQHAVVAESNESPTLE